MDSICRVNIKALQYKVKHDKDVVHKLLLLLLVLVVGLVLTQCSLHLSRMSCFQGIESNCRTPSLCF